MTKLTLDLQTSAEVLGTTPDYFLAWLQSRQPSDRHQLATSNS